MLGLNVRVMTETGKVSNQIVVDLLARCDIAHDEAFTCQIRPFEFGFGGQGMASRQHHEDPFAPEMLRFAAIPGCRSGYESDVQIQLPDGSDVLGRISIYKIDLNGRMARPEPSQEVKQKSRRQRRKYPDLEQSLVSPANRRPVRPDPASLKLARPLRASKRPSRRPPAVRGVGPVWPASALRLLRRPRRALPDGPKRVTIGAS